MKKKHEFDIEDVKYADIYIYIYIYIYIVSDLLNVRIESFIPPINYIIWNILFGLIGKGVCM